MSRVNISKLESLGTKVSKLESLGTKVSKRKHTRTPSSGNERSSSSSSPKSSPGSSSSSPKPSSGSSSSSSSQDLIFLERMKGICTFEKLQLVMKQEQGKHRDYSTKLVYSVNRMADELWEESLKDDYERQIFSPETISSVKECFITWICQNLANGWISDL